MTTIPPTNVTSLDNINNITSATAFQQVSGTNSPGSSVVQSVSTSTPTITSSYSNQLQANGINFTPIQNPLNVFDNYTYHIRFSLINEGSVYSLDGTYNTTNGLPKLIIAESGVTAGFNILDFEFTNYPTPGNTHLNTTATNWTMTITEPFGMTMIDKIFSSGVVSNWSRAPYIIEIWFNGYNIDGTVMSPNLFYVLYRVNLLDINVKLAQTGAVYSLNGVVDGDIGHSNELSIPQNQYNIEATTIGEFFTQFAQKLNTTTPNVNQQNSSSPLITYAFNIPQSIANYKLKMAQTDQVSQRATSMTTIPNSGVTTITVGKGTSMESIINQVLATSPNINELNSASSITNTGLSQWFIVHSIVQILGPDTGFTKDYFRNVTYSIIPYQSIVVPSDPDIVSQLQNSGTQINKLNTLINMNALVKEYDYIYTGLNTEITNLDLSIDNAWTMIMPQWSAINTHYNYVQPPLYNNGVGDKAALGTYVNPNSSTIGSFGGGGSGTMYAEDVTITSSGNYVFPIVIRQNNQPQAPNTDVSTDTSPALSNGPNTPLSRAFTGTYMQNLFGQAISFLNLELEIRGDPYWMGSGNIIDNNTALYYANGTSIAGAIPTPPPTSTTDPRYNFLASSVMLFLTFNSGQNYDPNTGFMQISSDNNCYSGAYNVIEVTNTFSGGKFTQKLTANKDIFAQNINSAGNNSGAGGLIGYT